MSGTCNHEAKMYYEALSCLVPVVMKLKCPESLDVLHLTMKPRCAERIIWIMCPWHSCEKYCNDVRSGEAVVIILDFNIYFFQINGQFYPFPQNTAGLRSENQVRKSPKILLVDLEEMSHLQT